MGNVCNWSLFWCNRIANVLKNDCIKGVFLRVLWNFSEQLVLREKCPCSEFFWSAFSRIRTEYGEIQSNYPCSVRMWENRDQENSEMGTFHAVLFTEHLHTDASATTAEFVQISSLGALWKTITTWSLLKIDM